MIDSNVISITALSVMRNRQRVLDDIDLEIGTGRLVGLLGPSGCGKTTLMRSLVGVQRVAAGAVTVLGLPAGTPSLRRRVAYTTQSPAVYADLTVSENLHYMARVLGVSSRAAAEVIDRVRLGEQRHQVVARLSGGQRARVSLAMALVADAELLILDEPTVGLDPLLRLELWRSFRDLADRGRTLLVSSHMLDEAERCDEIVLMRDGHMLGIGTPAELKRRTHTASVEDAFLALVQVREGAA